MSAVATAAAEVDAVIKPLSAAPTPAADADGAPADDVAATADGTATHQQPPPIFIQGLTILSPRQKFTTTSSAVVGDLSVALPPLRPEEPVASLRGALTEVLGFAHLTKYRLVVERLNHKSDGGSSGGGGGGGGNHNNKKKKLKQQQQKQDNSNNGCWSPFTLRNAQVTISPSFKSLENGGALPPNQAGDHDHDREDVAVDEELVLDEYGDLSILLSLLENNEVVDENEHSTDNNDNDNDNESFSQEKKIVLDATLSNICIRVVLEKYDVASIRDHTVRVRQLLLGNAPYCTSLAGDDYDVVVDDAIIAEKDEKDEKPKESSSVEKKNGTSHGEEDKKDDQKDEHNKAKEEEEETQEEKKAKLDALAKALPSFTAEHNALFESSTKGGDLTNFAYLACGEEHALLRLKKEQSGHQQSGGGEKGANYGSSFECSENGSSWLDDHDHDDDDDDENTNQKENKKKSNGGARKNKKKNNKSSNTNIGGGGGGQTKSNTSSDSESGAMIATNDGSHNKSMVEIERALYNLNESTHVSSNIQLSGYHPPPNHRRVLGDLAYLEATMPDGSIVHVTAFSLGFYVNRSSASTKFDPTPITGTKDACYSHSLLDCLLLRSKSLRSSWTAALKAAKQRSDLIRNVSLTEDSLANLFRPAASSFPNNASGPAVTAAGGMMVGMIMSATSPTTFTPRMDSINVHPSWLVPLPSVSTKKQGGKRQATWDHDRLHSYSASRAEEELTNVFGMDVRGGGLRDWNEELQTAREMPMENFGERIERARLVHKVQIDFADAALRGVKAILDGYILPMNPNEPARSHVYLHNNIFFSRAVDSGLDTFKIIQGDAAAKKSASRDASNMGVLHRLDIPGLHTLATVLVEYLGSRIVCQSVVPGILHGEKSHSLLYGAVETLSALQCNEEMHKLLESSIGEGCMVATRTIPAHPLTDERMDVIKKYRITPFPESSAEEKKDGDEDGKDKLIQVCGPMEMKGILGSDKRKYVLDCTRLTPRDANWVSKADGGTGRWEDHTSSNKMGAKSQRLVPSSLDDDEWTVCVLRPELVTNYAEMKIGKYLQERASGKHKDESGKKDKKEGAEPSKTEVSTDKKDSPSETTAAADEKGWVDVIDDEKKEAMGESKTKEVKESPLAKAEEEYIRSLRYNVNVFLPFTRSIETIDKDEHEKLKQDEEEARNLARHLWDAVIPKFTKEIRSSSGNGIQLPADGTSLTELIHQRGINCRYLGRLAELARKEELEDIIAFEKAVASAAASALPDGNDKTSAAANKKCRAPRFRMPICWLELLECEMVARAAKHVLDSYILEEGGGASTSQPAQMIASFLSAIVSVGEESAAESERRTTPGKASNGVLDQEEMNALTLFGGGVGGNGDEATPSPIRGREEIWSDIEREVGRRYRYTLSLYNATSGPPKKDGGEGRALYMPLLRRICQRSGIRLVAKQYSVGKKCVCGCSGGSGGLTTSYPIAPTDILDVLPLVKHAASVSGESFAPCSFIGSNTVGSASSSLHVLLPDAKTMYEVGHANLNNGNFAVTLEYAQESSAMYQRVLDSPVHPQISKCLKLTAIAHYHNDQPELALAAAAKYLAISISLTGFDSAEVLHAHMTMADILLGSGRLPEGVKHLRAAQYLMEFMAGKNYAGISSTYYRMGSHYYEVGKLEDSLRLYQLAATKRSEDRMFDCLIARHSAGVMARLGQFKPAFDYEKKAYQLYVTFLGEEHDASKACSNSLIQLMKLAVDQEKVSMIQEKARVKENAADAVADQIRADEEAEEAKPKKKKKQGGKNKKGKKGN